MNNKIISLLFVFVFLVFSLSGCNKKAPSNTEPSLPQTNVPQINKLSKEAFEEIKQFVEKDNATILFVNAEWCAACRSFKPTLKEVSKAYPQVKVIDINIDEHMDLARKVGIEATPTMLVFKKDQKYVKSIIGSIEPSELEKEFESLLNE